MNVAFTVENPHDSNLFRFEPIRQLIEKHNLHLITFDQCIYDHTLPNSQPNTYCRRRCCLLTNVSKLFSLKGDCPGVSECHKHQVAWGSIEINGKMHQAAQLAGRYPLKLCSAWADITVQHLEENGITQH